MAELRLIPAPILQEYVSLARQAARGLAGHPEADEAAEEGLLGALEALAALPQEKASAAHALVRHVARLRAWHFLQTGRCTYRRWTFHAAPLPPPLELDACPDWQREWLVGNEPDFAPPLIERLWREGVFAAVARLLSPEERAVLAAWLAAPEGKAGRIGSGNDWTRLQRAVTRACRSGMIGA